MVQYLNRKSLSIEPVRVRTGLRVIKNDTLVMSEEKTIRINEFSGEQSDWDGWPETFLAKAEHKGNMK